MTALTLAALGLGLALVGAGWSGSSVLDVIRNAIAGQPLPPTKPLFDVSDTGSGDDSGGGAPTFPSIEQQREFDRSVYGSLPPPGQQVGSVK
ncbi:MAG: hypothetical protein M3O70_09210 [Actinomycetota bacterium]|nr:hypothetical protein [Actinomycetota bacterium]